MKSLKGHLRALNPVPKVLLIFVSYFIQTISLQIGAHGKPVVFLHPKDCDGVLVELEQE